MNEFPEHTKLKKHEKKISLLINFSEYLLDKNIRFCEVDEVTGQYFSTYVPIDSLIAEYFKIDMQKIEEEKLELAKLLNVK